MPNIVTQFRDKGDEIHLHSLCYSELVRAYGEDKVTNAARLSFNAKNVIK